MGVAALPAGARSWAGRRCAGGECWVLSAPERAPQSAERAPCSPLQHVFFCARTKQL